MPRERKSLGQIKTLAALHDGRRVRSSATALLEMSTLSNERQRLQAELDRCLRRQAEIAERLGQIAAKQQWLRGFLDDADTLTAPGPGPVARGKRPGDVVTREVRY